MSVAFKVSVIVPVYGVERFIGRCARSLMEQTLDDVEFIFVDDSTPDRSMEELEKTIAQYPPRMGQVRIARHERNLGLPATRNTGLRMAMGEYVFHCDSDDYVEKDMLAQMYEFAQEKDCDVVWTDWYLTYAGAERYMRQPSYDTPMKALRAMLGGGMKYNVWNKLVRRSLYTENHIEFPAGYGMGEDMTMMMLFACANKVGHLPRAFYHYVKTNTESFSQTYSERHWAELGHNVQRVLDFIHGKFGVQLERELHFFRLEAKFPLLTTGAARENYRQWTSLYPESNCHICENRYIPMRSRMVQWCAWKGQWWLVRAYYHIVLDGLYKLRYK